MGRLLRLLLVPVLAAGALATSIAGTEASTMQDIMKRGEIRVAVQTQGPPVSFVDRNGERTGLAVEVVKMMAEDMGVKVVFQDYDWKGLIPALLSGKVDLIAADMTPTPQRATQLLFTDPVFFTANIAFTTKDKPFKHWQDLNKEGISVGATQASSYSAAVKDFMPKATLKEYAGGTAATAQAVASGRVDAGVTDSGTIKGFLEEYPDFVVLEGEISKEPLSFATRPDSMHLLMFMNNYIRLIDYNGKLDKLVDYWWNTTDWRKDH